MTIYNNLHIIQSELISRRYGGTAEMARKCISKDRLEEIIAIAMRFRKEASEISCEGRRFLVYFGSVKSSDRVKIYELTNPIPIGSGAMAQVFAVPAIHKPGKLKAIKCDKFFATTFTVPPPNTHNYQQERFQTMKPSLMTREEERAYLKNKILHEALERLNITKENQIGIPPKYKAWESLNTTNILRPMRLMMKYADGDLNKLFEIMKNYPQDKRLPVLIKISNRLSRGLKILKLCKFFLGDIKPSNILFKGDPLSPNFKVWLTDVSGGNTYDTLFDKLKSREITTLSVTKGFYNRPLLKEMTQYPHSKDSKSRSYFHWCCQKYDCFSLGVTLWNLYTGNLPEDNLKILPALNLQMARVTNPHERELLSNIRTLLTVR